MWWTYANLCMGAGREENSDDKAAGCVNMNYRDGAWSIGLKST